MLRINLSLLLVGASAIAAHASISTDFSDIAPGRSATILGSTPGFQATFGAGINGDSETSAGNIISSIGNNTDPFFFDPGSTSAFSVQRGTAGETNAYIRFDGVLARSVSLNVVTSALGNTVDNVSTGDAELEIRAFNSSTQLIDLSLSSFPDSGSTYNFTSADTGIRLLQLRLIGTDAARYVSTITSFSATATPEPSSMALLGLAGLSGAAVRRYRRRRTVKAE